MFDFKIGRMLAQKAQNNALHAEPQIARLLESKSLAAAGGTLPLFGEELRRALSDANVVVAAHSWRWVFARQWQPFTGRLSGHRTIRQ